MIGRHSMREHRTAGNPPENRTGSGPAQGIPPAVLPPLFSYLFFLSFIFVLILIPCGFNGVGGEGGAGKLVIELSNSTVEVDQVVYVNVTLSAENATGNVTVLVKDPIDDPVFIQSLELVDGNASFNFSLFKSDPNGTYSVYASAITDDDRNYTADPKSFEFVNWTQPVPPPVIPPPPDDDDGDDFPIPLPPAPLVVVGGLTSAAVLLGYSTDKGRYGLWMFVIPLYSRIRKEKTLDDFNRGQIYRTISEHPGIRYSEIGAKVGIGNGVLTHHLRVLQSMRYVKAVGDNTMKRFYLWGAAESLPPDLEKPFTPTQRSIVDYLSSHQWITQKDMELTLQIKQQTLSKNLKKLEQGNIVKRAREGNSFRYKLSEGYVHWLDQQISPKCPTCMNVCRIGARFCENCGTKLHET